MTEAKTKTEILEHLVLCKLDDQLADIERIATHGQSTDTDAALVASCMWFVHGLIVRQRHEASQIF